MHRDHAAMFRKRFWLSLWAELTTLVTIMLLGHWLDMRALGQAQGALAALAALAALLPGEAGRIAGPDGAVGTVGVGDLKPGDVVLVRPGASPPTARSSMGWRGSTSPWSPVSHARWSRAPAPGW